MAADIEMTRVPFHQGMQLNPHTVAEFSVTIPVGFWDHPIPKWMQQHPGEGYPSRRLTRRIMREARKAGWDSSRYDAAISEMTSR